MLFWKPLLAVGFGGFLGAAARYALTGWVARLAGHPLFPIGTLAVNVSGCFAIGLLAGILERAHPASFGIPFEARLFLFTGLLGGFTTFSAFGFETVFLIKRGEPMLAATNAALSVGLGVLFTWLGMQLIEQLIGS